MDDRLLSLLAVASFAGLGWVAGYAYAFVAPDVGTLIGLAVGLAYAAWYRQSNY
jgi:hypothetical protein